jgi:hypothetical protein
MAPTLERMSAVRQDPHLHVVPTEKRLKQIRPVKLSENLGDDGKDWCWMTPSNF